MKTWILYSIITLILWGLWGFLGKISSQHMPNKTLVIIACLGFALSFPIVYALFPKSFTFSFNKPSYYAALFSGIIAGLGVIFFYIALDKGDASRVVAFTAMYPLITVVLSYFFLHESMTVYKILGVFFALAAAFFLSL